ncbi:ATP-binding cassette subfamily B protein [Clostridium punense]|uniref:ATP-binding cassette subfamily B protein n=1 Tax=Clostridium punense TaxID=1054297 RepID=A0ABS4K724_9CLOT|nr:MULTISPECIES: ABC transporter ATP-binding protein [Clostridium]MBP2023085.1 ATP-binding cassette subfamily B protein [Clostridium punense]
MIKLLRFLKGSAILCAIIAPLMMLLEVSMDLMQPTFMSQIIDVGVAGSNTPYILSIGGNMLLAAFLGLIGGSGCSFFASIATMKLGQNLRQGLFNKIQTLSFHEIDTLKTSSLITMLTNDVTQVQNMMLTALRIMVRAPFLCIGSIIMSYYLSPKLATIYLIALPIIILAIIFILKYSYPLFLLLQSKLDNINLVMRENILGVKVIKVFNIIDKQLHRFNLANEELKNANIKAQNVNMILWPIVSFVMNLTVIAVIWFGGIMVSKDLLQVGIIMAFINYITQTMNSLIALITIVINYSRAKASADRINKVFSMVPSIKNKEQAKNFDNYEIEFKNVSFKYNETSEYVLKNINFNINQGEKVGIIGSTGSGKSTLVSLIARLYDATDGEVLIGGMNIKDINLTQLRENISLVSQENTIFSGTIEDNIKFGNLSADENLLIETSKDAEAYDFIMKKEKDFQSNIEQRGHNLSGGQKQRICIARALIKNSKIFIMDDSTSALDMATEARLQNSIKKRLKDKTMIVIAQRISGVMDADKIIVIDNGEISAIGSHDYLMNNNEIYRSIAISQLGEDVKKIG